jgi:hypothetical protein
MLAFGYIGCVFDILLLESIDKFYGVFVEEIILHAANPEKLDFFCQYYRVRSA